MGKLNLTDRKEASVTESNATTTTAECTSILGYLGMLAEGKEKMDISFDIDEDFEKFLTSMIWLAGFSFLLCLYSLWRHLFWYFNKIIKFNPIKFLQ